MTEIWKSEILLKNHSIKMKNGKVHKFEPHLKGKKFADHTHSLESSKLFYIGRNPFISDFNVGKIGLLEARPI